MTVKSRIIALALVGNAAIALIFYLSSMYQSQEQQNNQEDPNAPQVEYYKIPVAFEIQGNYLGYLK